LLALPGFRARRDIKDFSYPACCAAETSASFSTLILLAFASMASAIASRIFFLCSEVMAYRESLPKLVMLLDLVDEANKATCRHLELSLAAIAIPLASTSLTEVHKCAS
jgi:hypothetical protein